MEEAVELAKQGSGFAHPNPLVGCVVVKGDHVVARGAHLRCGEFHAERNALKDMPAELAQGATLYVTLEPCCHHGKTPPCTDIIIEKNIRRVVVAMLDPNPLVAGKGVEKLQKAGVIVDILEDKKLKVILELLELNRFFIKYIQTKIPYVILKSAVTLDGKTATSTKHSKWITCEESRREVHKLRHELMAVCVGIGTVDADDPLLNCRLEGNVCQPIRVIVDTNASISIDNQIVNTAKLQNTLICCCQNVDNQRVTTLNSKGVEVLKCKTVDGHVDVRDMLIKLGERGIDSLLLEGGATLNASFLKYNLVDEIWTFIAPKIVGGDGQPMIKELGITTMDQAIKLRQMSISQIGNDVLIKGKINVYGDN